MRTIDLGELTKNPLRMGGYSRKLGLGRIGGNLRIAEFHLCLRAEVGRLRVGDEIRMIVDGRAFVGNIIEEPREAILAFSKPTKCIGITVEGRYQ